MRNVDPSYPNHEWSVSEREVNKDLPNWSNFVKSGWRAAIDLLPDTTPRGLKLLVDGIVPAGSGLSSSSALVCSSCLAITRAYAQAAPSISRQQFASACMHAERLVGTMGGGMDQAISFLARENHGSRIDFDPLTATPCELPTDGCFVVANSLVESNKYITASSCFNVRVMECILAARLLAKTLGIASWASIRTLKSVQELSNHSKEEMVGIASRVLDQTAYTQEDLMRLLECDSLESFRTRHLVPEGCTQTSFCLKQ